MKCFIIFIAGISLGSGSFAQVNNNCSHAILLEVTDHCTSIGFSTASATAEPDSAAPVPSCGSYAGGDVWFKMVVPVSGALRIEVDNLKGATPPSFTLYSGSCGDFTEVICVRNDHNKTVYLPALAGDTIYIRAYSYFDFAGSEFLLCGHEPEIPANDECENALLLEVGQGCSLEILSNAYATAQPDNIAPEPSCGFYRGGDIWFKTVMPASGILHINKNRISGATNPCLTIYAGNCGHFDEVLCSANDATETLYNPSLGGQTLLLRLYSYSHEEGESFSLCLYEEAAPENDDCENAIAVSVGDTCAISNYSNVLATAQSVAIAPNPSCGSYVGGDVWLTIEIPASGNLRIQTENLSGAIPPAVAFYAGSCGNFVEMACMSNLKEYTFSDSLLAGEILYARVYTYNSDNGIPFSLCFFEPAMPDNDPCKDTVDAGQLFICQGETFTFGTQTITEAGEYPEVFQNQYNCDSLVNISVVVHEINTAVFQDGTTLQAEATGASYQWIDCANDNMLLAGETGQTFIADSPGDYAVIITENSCRDTSACYSIMVVDVAEEDHSNLILFPNPVNEVLFVELPRPQENGWIELIDIKGEIVKTEYFQGKSTAALDISGLSSGGYIVRIHTKREITLMKMIKK